MYVIMGGNGHVGAAVAEALHRQGRQIVVLTHDAGHADAWHAKKVEVVVADVNDVSSLRAAFRCGRRAFLLNPPADTSLDTDAVERRTVLNILAALEGSGLEKVVAESTFGAQPGERIADLSVLWELERGLQRQSIPAAINRAAYYMSNWEKLVDAARTTGKLPTMYPADFVLPMVAPQDLGKAAAARLVSSTDDTGIRYVEGPRRYSSADVASAFARALGRSVELNVTPRGEWKQAYRKLGFSEAAADSYARMTAVSVDGGFSQPDEPILGKTTLESYVRDLIGSC